MPACTDIACHCISDSAPYSSPWGRNKYQFRTVWFTHLVYRSCVERCNAMECEIRSARAGDSEQLTQISLASKRYWKYPDSYLDVWREELTITPSYIEKNLVYVAEQRGVKVGYYSLVDVDAAFWAGQTYIDEGTWLEHMFIEPKQIGKGIGTLLMKHAGKVCSDRNVSTVRILADPHAKGFYEKSGAKFVRDVPSNIEGRTVAYFEWQIDQCGAHDR